MNRAWRQLHWFLRYPTAWWKSKRGRIPRPHYCEACGVWSWSTWELGARTLDSYGWLCEPCADENDIEWSAAWADYYGGRL